jgi:glycosyltransferase involved in cell wall biosynthesis
MIFNESKVLGLPILTTDFGSSYEFIDDKRIGRITDINNIEQLLAEFIANPQILNRMRANILETGYNNNSIIISLRKLFQ